MTINKNCKSLWQMFVNSNSNYSNKPIFHLNQYKSINYNEFYNMTCNQINFLKNKGIGKGDHIVVIGKNTYNWACLSYAINSIGGIFIPIFEEQQNEITSHMLNQVKPKIIFNSTDKSILKLQANNSITEINHETFYFDNYKNKTNIVNESELNENDIATILYTSGTSGMPKGVPLTNKNILSNINAIKECTNVNNDCIVTSDDKFVSFLPWNHSYGYTGELNYIVSNGASIYRNNVLEKLRTDILNHNPTIMCTVPRLFQLMYKKVCWTDKYIQRMPVQLQTTCNKIIKNKLFGKNIRFCTVGGSTMPEDILNYFNNIGLQIYEGYGTTECSPMITLNNPPKKFSVGKVINCNKIMIDTIEDESGDARIYYNNNNIGEILVSGDNVMSNYLGYNVTESHKYCDGKYWYKTGDVGYLENDYLYLTGRIKEQFKLSNGKFVDYVHIENILLSIPEIKQIVVFGKDEEYLSAIVVTDSTEKIIREKINKITDKFKKYEIPQKLILTNELFTTENGLLTQKKSQKRNEIITKYTYKI